MTRNYKLVLAALMAICMVQGCSKKQEGCKLDSECPNGQICRNMKCEAAPAGDAQPAGEAQPAEENKADDGAQDGNAAANPAEKPTVPVEINLGYLQDNKIAKLEDLGLDIDYILDESLDLHGTQKLEIGPGVTIDMRSSSSAIRIYDDAALMVKGTEAAPVIFKSTNSSAWSGIHFGSKNKDNTLNYLQIQNADGEDGVIDLGYESRVGIDHLTLDGSSGHGIHIGGDSRFTKFTNNTIKNCKDFPIILDSYASISDIGEGNVFENNRQFIQITAYTFDDVKNTVIKKQPIPYYFSDGVNVDGDSGTLTIEAGTEFVFEHEKSMRIGESIQLKLEGTTEAPVIMRGLNDEAHFWQGFIYDSTRPGTISGLVMSNTGYDEIPSMRIRSDANVTIQNITFKATDHRCLEIGSDAKVINKGGLSFEKCGKGNIYDERVEGEDEQKILNELPVTAE